MKPIANDNQLSKILLKGYKSFAACEIDLGMLNILIGANGAGKTNFISFFRMIQQMLDQEGKFQAYISKQGGPDAILHFGRKITDRLDVELYFGDKGYLSTLKPSLDNRLMFADESLCGSIGGTKSLGRGHFESKVNQSGYIGIDKHVVESMRRWRIYHFHDTSESSLIKRLHSIGDNMYLRADGSNLAAFLFLLREHHKESYAKIVNTIRLVAPFFGDFCLRPALNNPDMIELEWFERGQDVPWKAHILSDGTIRFICLTTVFLQPSEFQPETILVDEPELGLHPYAIIVLGSLIRSISSKKQLIISTQSSDLLSEFDPEDILVVNRDKGASEVQRLSNKELEDWLKEYTLGDLWKKNLLGGRPSL
jgi:predicted ATPase